MALETGFAYFVSGRREIHIRREIVRLVRPAVLCGALISVLHAFASPVHLETEHRTNPLGVDATAPRFAWQSDSRVPNWMQQGYEIHI